MQKSPRILITGSNGFIGSRLKNSFLNDGQKINELAKDKQSLFDISSLKEKLENTDIIFHFAGATAGSGHDPGKSALIRNNIEATFNLLKAIKVYCKKTPLLINMSSIHVYDKSLSILSETSELLPSNTYGMTKLAQEFLVKQATFSGTIKSIIFRASNIYGEGDRPNHNSAIATFCHKIKHDSEIQLFANGEATFDLIYIDDVIQILRNVQEIKANDGQVFNIASGNTVTINQVVEHLEKIANKNIKKKMVEGSTYGFSVKIDKLKKEFSEIKQHNLFEGLKKTYEGTN